ncbi:DUF4332 domain-containing protein [Aeoliella sp. SH292]|uniref:DUF4332 domain-containing protein n=1 Tax=Aeoliella sp. SH292 TaxID=3454464 RepID=UPI003F9CCC2C
MKLEHLAVGGAGGNAPQHTLTFADGLTVVAVNDATTGRQVADLVGHLVYGARIEGPHLSDATRTGHVDIASRQGRFRLARQVQPVHRGAQSLPRLTVAALEGQPAHPDTTRDLLAGITPEIAARLFVLQSSGEEQTRWLLSEELAAAMHAMERAPHDLQPIDAPSLSTDDLFALRDRLSHRIEMLLAGKRLKSAELEATIADLNGQAESVEQFLDDHRRQLDSVLGQLTELETQLRYRELSEFVGRATDEAHHQQQQPRLDDLDDQITKWRQALAELEGRDAQVRYRLTLLHPDDSSPLLPLADQRACMSIAQRLVADLDSEVARYARPADSADCLCRNTHARLHPLVDTLGQQVTKLTKLVAQYEAAIEVEQLRSEAGHLARSQASLRETIDHLLDRRQSYLRTSRSRRHTDSDVAVPGELSQLHTSLELRRTELQSLVADAEERLNELTARRERTSRERAELLRDPELVRLREELEDVNHQLELGRTQAASRLVPTSRWRASDILAKLTDGRLRELRLTDQGRRVVVTSREGVAVPHHALSEVDRRLVTISLQLAAVAGATRWGYDLPLIAADPFADLPATSAAILALVLLDWAREGHQVLLVTAARPVSDRLRAVGQPIVHWDTTTSIPTPPPVVVSTPAAEPIIALHDADTYALELGDSIERFSVFGEDTTRLFDEVGIRTIAELLDANADEVAHQLDRTGITSSIVELWQTHVSMLTYIPNLTLSDVQVLTGAGVRNLNQLADADAEALYAAICEYFESPQGTRHQVLRKGLGPRTVRHWIADAARTRYRWESTPYAARTPRTTTKQSPSRGPKLRGGRAAKATNSKVTRRTTTTKSTRPLRFRLSRSSAVVDAPSVGPKLAKRLAKLGIKTVADLLEADAARTAAELKANHVNAEKIVAWQHQAQLICRVPELLARDAQVLVGCGFTTPEDIATAKPADLLEFAKSYTTTPEGTRALRGADAPDLARVTNWVYWAGHRRALEAA